jgi:hypothetical protein
MRPHSGDRDIFNHFGLMLIPNGFLRLTTPLDQAVDGQIVGH